jgi:hypothetical protein
LHKKKARKLLYNKPFKTTGPNNSLSCQWLTLNGSFLPHDIKLPSEIEELTFTFVIHESSCDIISKQIRAMENDFRNNKLNVTNLEIEFHIIIDEFLKKEYKLLNKEMFIKLCESTSLDKASELSGCLCCINTFLSNLNLYFSFKNLKIRGFASDTAYCPHRGLILCSTYAGLEDMKMLEFSLSVGLAKNTENVEISSTEISCLKLRMRDYGGKNPSVKTTDTLKSHKIRLFTGVSYSKIYKYHPDGAILWVKEKPPSCLSLWTCC